MANFHNSSCQRENHLAGEQEEIILQENKFCKTAVWPVNRQYSPVSPLTAEGPCRENNWELPFLHFQCGRLTGLHSPVYRLHCRLNTG